MPKLHEIYPEAYESCGHCSGSGKKVEVRNDETRQIDCPRCGGTGRIKKSTGIKPDPSSADYRSPTISKPIARTKEELKTRFEEALAKAKQLQKSLLDAIQSSLQLSSEMMYSSHKFISSIDPLSKDVKESLEKLQLEWSRKLSRQDQLLRLLREFKHACFDAQTYYSFNF